MRHRVAIIGGGVSGLAAANYLIEKEADVDVTLFEAGSRLGGVIQTTRRDGFLIESAADNFITTPPYAVQLCKRIGLEDQLIGTNPSGRKAMVVRKGKLEPIPAGFLVMAPSRLWPLVTTKTMGVFGKLRAGCEYFIPRKYRDEDESLRSFVCRRFGREMFETLVQPLVGGIYTADPEQLSVAATMPRFLEMEREHGSLIRAMMRARKGKPADQTSGARYGQFATLAGGMGTLVDALTQRIPKTSVSLQSRIESIRHQDDTWTLTLAGDQASTVSVDAIIMAAPAKHAAGMLRNVDAKVADELAQIPYASCGVLSLAYRRDQIGHDLDAFGFVVPMIEKRQILSCSFSSMKYDGRAPEGHVLLRVYIGGACQGELLDQSDEQLYEIAESELAALIGVKGEPLLRQLTRQVEAMPQYHVGHCERKASIERRLENYPTLAMAGNALHGVGIPGCIDSGEKAAERVLSGFDRVEQAKEESIRQ